VTFLAAVLFALLPISFGAGTLYGTPEIFDAPKSIIAITALSHLDGWPAASPFFAGAGFAYNYGFYILPAAIIGLTGANTLALSMFPWLTVLPTGAVLLVTAELSEELGLSRAAQAAAMLFASWAGGLIPLLVHQGPAMGFRLLGEHVITDGVWPEDPFVYAIFVPQHIVAVAFVLAMLRLAGESGPAWTRMAAAALLAFAGCTASLILLPPIVVIFCLLVGLIILHEKIRPATVGAGLAVGLAFAALLLPFALDAVAWQKGTGGAIIGLPHLDTTAPIDLLATGPLVAFAVAGLLSRTAASRSFVAAGLVLVAVTSFAAAFVLQYQDAGLKSLLLFRWTLPPLAGIGLMLVARSTWLRGLAWLACILCVVINLPTIGYFDSLGFRPRAADETALFSELQATGGRVLFDGIDSQWVAAIAAVPTNFDFRLYRADAYMPPGDRSSYASFFDRLPDAGVADAPAFLATSAAVLASAERSKVWRQVLGPPEAEAFGFSLFRVPTNFAAAPAVSADR